MGERQVPSGNVAIIVTKLNGGGAERVASNLSIELSQFFNVSLIAFDGRDRTYQHAGTLYDLKTPPRHGFIGRICNVLRRMLLIRKIKNEQQVDWSISLLDGPNLMNVLTRSKDRVIISVRNMPSEERVSGFRKHILSLTASACDRIVAVSKMVEQDLVDNFGVNPEKTTVIYNSCDVERLVAGAMVSDSDAPDLQADLEYVVTMGRLVEQKGQWHLIRAFRQVAEAVPKARLLIIGEGELRSKLEALTDDLGLRAKVVFAGYLKNPHTLIKQAAVFAFPSLYEGLGNAILEALALGKAVVSTDCLAGPREILNPATSCARRTDDIEFGEYGVLVPVGDRGHFSSFEPLTEAEKALAHSIELLLVDRQLRAKYEAKAVERSRQFLPSEVTAQWVSLLNELGSGREGDGVS